MVLQKMKQIAEDYLGETVNDAVVTVCVILLLFSSLSTTLPKK